MARINLTPAAAPDALLAHIAEFDVRRLYLPAAHSSDLLARAAHRTKSDIEELLAVGFPRSEAMGLVVALPASLPRADGQPAPGHIDFETPQLAPGQVGPRAKLAPVAAERYMLEVTLGRSTQEKLRHFQDLLGHEVPSGDLAQVLDRVRRALSYFHPRLRTPVQAATGLGRPP